MTPTPPHNPRLPKGRRFADSNSEPLKRSVLLRVASLVLVLPGVGLFTAACGGIGSPPGVASVGSTTTTTQVAAAGKNGNATPKYLAALVYVDCMRSHGVPNFPDPTSDGQINVDFAHGGKGGSPMSSGIDRNSSQYISASNTCQHLLPGGVPTPGQNQQALVKELKFAQCMRSHGVSNFPDPTNAGVVRLIGVDQNSPQYQSAQKACEVLEPGVYSK